MLCASGRVHSPVPTRSIFLLQLTSLALCHEIERDRILASEVDCNAYLSLDLITIEFGGPITPIAHRL